MRKPIVASGRIIVYAGCMIDKYLERVRAAIRDNGVSPGALAKRAGLHRNTLYGFDRPTWNPTAQVLQKLEPHIVAIERGKWKAEETSQAA